MKTTNFLSHQTLILLCIFHSITTTPNVWCYPIRTHHHPSSSYITKSCSKTLYPKLCNKTLSKHSAKIKSSPKLLAVTALVATFNATQTTSWVLRRVRRAPWLRRAESESVIECLELVSDAVYELQKSIKELNQTRRGPLFEEQINDVQTWVSAALTDDDTCMDDFRAKRRIRIFVRGFVLTIARLTSISLTFINNYAAL